MSLPRGFCVAHFARLTIQEELRDFYFTLSIHLKHGEEEAIVKAKSPNKPAGLLSALITDRSEIPHKVS